MTSYISDFAALFSGHKSSYVVHIPPFTTTGNKVKAKRVYYKKFQGSEEFVPLNLEDYERHLNGSIGLAVSPLTGNNDGLRDGCYFALIDIDVYDSDITIEDLEELFSEYPCMIKHSKSHGFHIFFFFKDMENSKEVRQQLTQIRYLLGLEILFPVKRVEIFPEYDHITDKKAHCIFLPFFEGKQKEVTAFIKQARKKLTSVDALQKITEQSRFSFLPVCIEAALNAHTVRPMAGRNNFLFSIATFLTSTEVEDLDGKYSIVTDVFIDEDFSTEEAETVLISASKNNYSFLGRCKSAELKALCNKKICKERVFESGSAILDEGKNRVLTNVDFGQLYKYNAQKPFYIWEIKKTGSEGGYVKVQFETITQLLQQKLAQGIIGEAVDTIFLTLKNEIWENHIEAALKSMITVEVNILADHSDQALAVRMVYQFLLEQTTPYDEPLAVFQGRAYRREDVFFFLIESLIAYLYAKGYGTKKLNLYTALSSVGATTDMLEGMEVWSFHENHTYRELEKSREKIRMIEKQQLAAEIEGRFETQKQIEG